MCHSVWDAILADFTTGALKNAYFHSMKPERTVQQHIDMLHQKVRKLKAAGMPDENIIELLREDGVDEIYAQTLLENVANDKDQKKGFWKLLAAAVFTFFVAFFLHFSHQFDGRRLTLIYQFIFWCAIISGITMLFRAFVVFRK